MGADMVALILPDARPSKNRRKILFDLIEKDKDFIADEWNTPEDQVIDVTNYLLDEWETDLNSRRDVSQYRDSKFPYDFLITGGMSWGDDPTEACNIFDKLSLALPVWNKLVNWAIKDKKQRIKGYKKGKRDE